MCDVMCADKHYGTNHCMAAQRTDQPDTNRRHRLSATQPTDNDNGRRVCEKTPWRGYHTNLSICMSRIPCVLSLTELSIYIQEYFFSHQDLFPFDLGAQSLFNGVYNIC